MTRGLRNLRKWVFCDGTDTDTDTNTHGHGDSLTESAQRANSVKISMIKEISKVSILSKTKIKKFRETITHLWADVQAGYQ